MPRRFSALQWAGLALIAAILLLSGGAYLWASVNGALG